MGYTQPLRWLSSNQAKPLQVSAMDTAKMSMTAQEPQLLDKMESVAYRLDIQAEQRKKHMNSRYCSMPLSDGSLERV